MTVLVTGGAGYIGSYVNKKLDEAGYRTVVLDNLSSGVREAVTRGVFIEGDIGNRKVLEQLFNDYTFDAVIHLAASTSVEESVNNPTLYYRNNVYGTMQLLDAMQCHGVPAVVFSSSAAVYGIPEREKVCEGDATRPINPYGRSKLIGEQMLADYERAYGCKSISLRYFNAAGSDPAGEIKALFFMRQHNIIPTILRTSASNAPAFIINGVDYPTRDGTCIRDYIHIDDLADAHLRALNWLAAGGESSIYNLGNGAGFSVRDVVTAAQKATGVDLIVTEGPRRIGDPPILVAEASKAESELGWRPRHCDITQMISDSWVRIAIK